ncbi:hypothetical protein DIC75_06390 [Methanoculleus sp. CWC-02]|uniref:Protein NO VEIN C-terminal domain-containing protein n=2 Tax=Methanoculleus oceani TaxID=2184756 RepID=A0ABD4TD78_9EURY|nr:hypothetical protein [Methanoculleus sp. CWC-02]
MELIQNAEDNTYDPTVQPFIRFSIKPDTLIVYNNEIGFAPEDVESICSVGQTTKSKKKNVGYIGEKGIGFKSVFKISDFPKVISNGFQFEFRRSYGSNLGYIVPYWLPAIPEYADRQVTNIILPLRDDARERLNLFDEIDPTLILFLRKLQRIEIIDNVSGNSKAVTKSGSEGLVTIDYQDQSQYWRVIRATFRVPQEIVEQEPRREDVKNTEIVLAFPVSETGLPISIRNEPKPDIFAFLPVKKCGFSFIIQADFLLTSDREDILQDSQWNQWLRSNILDVLVKAIEEFKRDEKLKTTFFKYLSLPEEINDEFFNPFTRQTFEALADVECILTESGLWKKPCDVYYAEDDLKNLVSNDELCSNFAKEYVADTFYLKKELRAQLGIVDFTSKHLVECLENPDWVKKHPNEWLIELYRYCAQQLKKAKPDSLTLDNIIQLPIIKLENGDYCSADSGQVFFELERSGKKYGFESDLEGTLRVLDASIRNAVKAGEDVKDLTEFLKKLNVINPDPSNIINQHILPQYLTGAWGTKPSEILQGHIRFIKDHFEKLQKVEGLIGTIGKTIYLKVNGKQGQSGYRHPDQIYLSDDYESRYHLSSTMAAAGETFFLENSLHPCYIRSDLKSIDAEIQQILAESRPKKGKRTKKRSQVQKQVEPYQKRKMEVVSSWKEFVMALGVREGIFVLLDPETERYEGGERANNVVTKKRIYRYDFKNTLWGSSGWKNTESAYFIEDDYISADLDRIFGCFCKSAPAQQKDISFMLFKLFLDNWDDYRGCLECRYYYRYLGEHGWKYDKTQTTFLLKLKTFPWVTTTDGTFAPLKGLFLNSSDIRRILENSIKYIGSDIDPKQHTKFINDVEIRTSVDINEIIEVIDSKVRSGSENVEEFKYLYSLLQELIPKRTYSGSYLNPPPKQSPFPALHAFREGRLIFIPETDQKYFTADDVFWDCQFDNLKEHLPSLRTWYSECRGLFIDGLVVKERPAPQDLVTTLEQISANAERSEVDERKIITIYKEFNRLLKQYPGNSNVSWWKDFTGKFLLWVNKKQFWRNDGDVFANDDPALYDLFVEWEDIAFLAVDITDLRDLEHFVKYAKISKLSESVKCVLTDGRHQTLKNAPELTRRIQDLTPYILRYLYNKHPEDYDRLKSSHKLINLKDIQCVLLDRIDVEYILRNRAVKTTRDVLLDGNTLYVGKIDQSQVPIEFAKFFGPIKDLDIFICHLFTHPNSESVEKFLDSVKIPQLPYSEVEWFTSLNAIDQVQDTPTLLKPKEKPLESELETSSISRTTSKNCLLPEEISSNSDAVEPLPIPPSSSILPTPPPRDNDSGLGGIPSRSQSGQPRTLSHPEEPSKHRNVEDRSFEPENEDIDILTSKNPELVRLVHVAFSPRQRKGNPNDLKTNKLPERPESEEKIPESERYKEDKRLEIGHWGEEVVYQDLKQEMQKRYPGASMSDTEDGFVLSQNGDIATEVIWHNKTRKGNDRGYGHDIKVVESGKEIYIEVKSSIKPREAFMISKNEWDLAKESGDRYFIFHVYYSPSEGIMICEKIQNPVKRWQLDELEARIIQVQL